MWKKKERNLILCNYVTQWMSTCDVKVIYNCYNKERGRYSIQNFITFNSIDE